MHSKLDQTNPVGSYKLFIKARKKINVLQGSLYTRISPLPFIREINILALFSSFSHILHGNVLLLNDILQSSRVDSQKRRIYWFLLLTGINTVNRIGDYINNTNINEEIKKINDEFIEISKKVEKNWV